MAHSLRQMRYREGDEPVPGYRLVRWLGEGGMGEVWKATSAGGIEVAMKILYGVKERAGRKELRALQLVKKIRHPNLVPITAFWLKDEDGNILDDSESEDLQAIHEEPAKAPDLLRKTLDIASVDTDVDEAGEMRKTPAKGAAQLIIAMGLGDGSLFGRLEECRDQGLQGIPEDELLDYMEDAAKAIDFLNIRHGIQHCDIKPQNILIVGEAGQVCDFGLAKSVQDTRRTSTNAVTIAYGAPEVMMSGEPASSTDQYSLAVSYVELRSGRLPFASDTMTGVIDAKRTGELDLQMLTEAERPVVERATALKPEQRFPTCVEFVRELRRALAAKTLEPYLLRLPEPVAAPTAPRASRRKLWLTLAGLPFVIGAALLFLLPGEDGRGLIYGWIPGLGDRNVAHVEELIADGQFAAAHAAINELDGDAQREATAVLAEAWLEEASAHSDRPRLALGVLDDLLTRYPTHAGALQARREVLEGLLADVNRRLAAPQLLAADLEAIDNDATFLEQQLADDISTEQEGMSGRVQLARARLAARRDEGSWGELADQLSDIDSSRFTPAERANYAALRAITSSNVGGTEQLAAMFELADPQLSGRLTSWEQAQVDRVRHRALAAIDLQALDSHQREMVASIWPAYELDLAISKAEELRRRAIESLALGQLDQARQQLAETRRLLSDAQSRAMDDAERQRLRTLSSQVDVYDPEIAAPAALEAFTQAASHASSENLLDLAQALARRVQQDPSIAAGAAEQLGLLFDPAGADTKIALAPAYAEVLEILVLHPPGDAAFIATLQNHSQRIRAAGVDNPFVAAAWAEAALAESESTELGIWKQADDAVQLAAPLLADQPNVAGADYLLYVRGLVSFRNPLNPDYLTAAQDVYQALTAVSASNAFENATRRGLAARILGEAASRLRTSTDEDIAQPAYSTQAAEVAYRYLTEAAQLGLATADVYRNRLYAAALREMPDWDEVRRLAEAAFPENGTIPRQVLLISAQALSRSDDPEQQAVALVRYGELLTQLAAEEGKLETAVPGVVLYERIIEPASALAENFAEDTEMTEEMRSPVARLIATKARLVQKDPLVAARVLDTIPAATEGGSSESPAKPEPAQLAHDGFARAYAIDPLPEYLVRQGEALMERTDVESTRKLQSITDLAGRAIKDVERMSDIKPAIRRGAYSLMSSALLLQSRATPSPAQSMDLLRQALGYYDQFIPAKDELPQTPTAELAQYLVGRSAALLELAFYVEDNDEERALLMRAIEDAQSATQAKDYHRPDHAWLAWGNAEEDLALYVERDAQNKEAQTKRYQNALARFQSAVFAADRIQKSKAASFMALGRARYRFATSPGLVSQPNRPEQLRRAVTDLEQALLIAGINEKPEIHLWLTQAHEGLGDMDAALQHCRVAAELARVHNKLQWPTYQLKLIQLAPAAEKQELAGELIRVAEEQELGYSINLKFLAGAVNVLIAQQSTVRDVVDTIDRYLKHFPAEDTVGRAFRFNFLITRIATIIRADDATMWQRYATVAEDDGLEVVDLSEDGLSIDFQVQGLDALAAVYAKYFQTSSLSSAERAKHGRRAVQTWEEAVELHPGLPRSLPWRLRIASFSVEMMTLAPTERAAFQARGLKALEVIRDEREVGRDNFQLVEGLRRTLRS